MAFQSGTRVDPSLNRMDFSAIERGGQAIAAGIMSAGQSIGSAIEQRKEYKDYIKQADAVIKSSGSLKGVVDDRILQGLGTLGEQMGNEEIPLSQRAAIASQILQEHKNVVGLGLAESQRQSVARSETNNRMVLDDAIGAATTPEGTVDLQDALSAYFSLGGTGNPLGDLSNMAKTGAIDFKLGPAALENERLSKSLAEAQVRTAEAGATQEEAKADVAGRKAEAEASLLEGEAKIFEDKSHAEIDLMYSQADKYKESNPSVYQKKTDEAAAADAFSWETKDRSLHKYNMQSLGYVVKGLKSGDVTTGGLREFLPLISDEVRNMFNADSGQAVDVIRAVAFQSLKQTLGGQFSEREGENLVRTFFNPQLDPKQNIMRLEQLMGRMEDYANMKDSMVSYLKENETLKGWSAPTIRDFWKEAKESLKEVGNEESVESSTGGDTINRTQNTRRLRSGLRVQLVGEG